MINTRTRTLAALATAALVLAPLAGCGSDDAPTRVGNPPAASASQDAEPSAAPSTSTAAARLTRDNFVDVMAKAMAQKGTAHVNMTFGAALSLEGDVDYSGSGSATRMTMRSAGLAGEVIYAGDAMYLSMAGATPEGKYIKVSSDDPQMGKMLGQLKGVGPEGSLRAMKEGLRKFQYAGKDTIAGEQVSKYVVTVSLADAAKAMGSTPDQLKGAPDSVTYDMYVTKENLMRRMVLELVGQTMQMDVTDWGKPVTIKAPSAGDIVQAPPTS